MKTSTKSNSFFPYLIISFLALSLGACSSLEQALNSEVANVTATEDETVEVIENKSVGLIGKYQESWSFCIPSFVDDEFTCSIGYLVENPTDTLIEISYSEIYAVVDGKVFKAASDQGSDGTDWVSQTWNPGEELKAVTYFNVPAGSTIEQIFFADEPNPSQAEMIFDVYIQAQE